MVFGWLKKKQKVANTVATNNEEPPKESPKESQAHLKLLSRFIHGSRTAQPEQDEYWVSALEETPATAIERFISQGYLQEASLPIKLSIGYSVKDLKYTLKKRGLKVSGLKQDLINRLVENDPEEMKKLTSNIEVYECTKDGEERATKYLKENETKKEQVRVKANDALNEKKFHEAVILVAEFKESQVFGGSGGKEWKRQELNEKARLLKSIFGRPPKILKGVNKERLSFLRFAAATKVLWGTNNAKDTFPDGFETGFHLDPYMAAQMLIFFAKFKDDKREWKKMGTKTVEISGGGEYSCDACNAIAGQKYSVNEVPELPHAGCTSEGGCHCMAFSADYD